jgi:hypothetical protein
MSDTLDERLERELEALTEIPRDPSAGAVLIEDAEHVARFCEVHYEPVREGGRARPGLRDVRLPPTTAADMYQLIAALWAMNVDLHERAVDVPRERLRWLLRELQAQLGWLAANRPALGPAVESLADAHAGARRAGALASAIGEHLVLVRKYAAELRDVGAYDDGVVEEADATLRTHRQRLAVETDLHRVRRAGMATLLRQRMRLVLAAADFVFRHHPEVAREARSERLRQQHAQSVRARKRNRAANPPADPPPAPVTPSEDPTA